MFKQADLIYLQPYPAQGADSLGLQVLIEDDEYGTLPVSYALTGQDLADYLAASDPAAFLGDWLKKRVKVSHDTWVQEFEQPPLTDSLPDVSSFPSITQLH